MYHSFKLFLFALILSLIACNDNASTTAPLKVSQKTSNETGQLRLDVPSLLGLGEISEIKMTIGDTIELVATLETPTGESIPNQPLYISSNTGNFFTENQLVTDHNGQASSLLLATVLGKDTITVTDKISLSTTLAITINDLDNSDVVETTFLEELPGVVSWKTLAKVTIKKDIPHFEKEVEALNGKEVKVQGFMMPLENTEKQKHFILSVTPPSCFFCLPASSEGIVEIYAEEGIEFSFDPIIMTGTLNVLKNDEMGLYYRMQNAQQISL
jgi:hypothetical protein